MTCNDLRRVITDYLEGELTAEHRVLLEHHLHACSACREYLQQMQSTIVALSRLPAVTPPRRLRAQVLSAFRKRWVPDQARGRPAWSRLLTRLEGFARQRYAWALVGLPVIVSLLLALTSGPGTEIARPGLPRVCLPTELIAGLIPALGLLTLSWRMRQRISASAFALVGGAGACTGQLLLFVLCPMLESRVHALVIHVGGVAVATLVGAALGSLPIQPRPLQGA